MKNLTTALLTATIAVGALAGCQTTPNTPSTPDQNMGAAQPVNSKILQAYDWQLVDAKRADGTKIAPLFYNPAKSLTLKFTTEVTNQSNEDRVSFVNTCNNLGAAYSIRNGSVELNNALSTMMSCPEPEAKFDSATMAIVQGKYSVSQQGQQAPVLTIQGKDTVAHFKAVKK